MVVAVHDFYFGPDGERQTEGTDASRKRDARSSAGHPKSEDTSDSREDEVAVSVSFPLLSLPKQINSTPPTSL